MGIHGFLKTTKARFSEAWYAFWMLLFRLCPIDRNKIVVSDMSGRPGADSPGAIVRSLLDKRPGVKVVWVVRPELTDAVQAPCRAVKRNSIPFLYAMATAKVWLHTSRQMLAILKRPKQYYIQAWHGDIPLKHLEAEVTDTLSPSYVAIGKIDGKKTDLMLSGSRLFTGLCPTAFWYDGEVMECGVPRLDRARDMSPDRRAEVLARLGVPAGAGAVLYAPTFRKNRSVACYDMDYAAVLALLRELTGRDWVLLIRLHPHMNHLAGQLACSDTVINATDYPDLYELLPAVDMVISDYSSVLFEAAQLGKPTFMYASDIAQYEKDRGFRFDLRALPFPLAEDTGALLDNIRRFDPDAYGRDVGAFFDSLGVLELGGASDKVADRILDVMDGRFPPPA